MKTYKEFLNEAKYKNMKSATQLKVGDVVLYGNDDTPHEVVSKPEQDTLGHWVKLKNLATNKDVKAWVDVGDKMPMNESAANTKKTLIELNKGREGKTAIAINGDEMKGTVYLGNGSMAEAEGNDIRIREYSFSTGKYETNTFTKEQVKWMSRL